MTDDTRDPGNWEVVITLDRASLPRLVTLHTVRYTGPGAEGGGGHE